MISIKELVQIIANKVNERTLNNEALFMNNASKNMLNLRNATVVGSGIIYEIGENGLIISGTATTDSFYYIIGDTNNYAKINIPTGTYVVDGMIPPATLYIEAEDDPLIEITNTQEIEIDETKRYKVYLKINNNTTIDDPIELPLIIVNQDIINKAYDEYYRTLKNVDKDLFAAEIDIQHLKDKTTELDLEDEKIKAILKDNATINYFYMQQKETYLNGFTFIVNTDQSLTITGTGDVPETTKYYIYGSATEFQSIDFPTGRYILRISDPNIQIHVEQQTATGSTTQVIQNWGVCTFTNDFPIKICIVLGEGRTVDTTLTIGLTKVILGEEVPFEPYYRPQKTIDKDLAQAESNIKELQLEMEQGGEQDASQNALLIDNAARNLYPFESERTVEEAGFLVQKGNIRLPRGSYRIMFNGSDFPQGTNYEIKFYNDNLMTHEFSDSVENYNEILWNNSTVDVNKISFSVDNVCTISNIIIQRAAITDTSFDSYYRTQRQLDTDLRVTETAIKKHDVLLKDNATVNHFDMQQGEREVNGYSFIVNNDTSISISGTGISAEATRYYLYGSADTFKSIGFPSGVYYVTVSDANVTVVIEQEVSGGDNIINYINGQQVIAFDSQRPIKIYIQIDAESTIDTTFTIAITNAELGADIPYEPYYRSQKAAHKDLEAVEKIIKGYEVILDNNAARNLNPYDVKDILVDEQAILEKSELELPVGTYYVSFTGRSENSDKYIVTFYADDDLVATVEGHISNTEQTNSFEVTLDTDINYINFIVEYTGGGSAEDYIQDLLIQDARIRTTTYTKYYRNQYRIHKDLEAAENAINSQDEILDKNAARNLYPYGDSDGSTLVILDKAAINVPAGEYNVLFKIIENTANNTKVFMTFYDDTETIIGSEYIFTPLTEMDNKFSISLDADAVAVDLRIEKLCILSDIMIQKKSIINDNYTPYYRNQYQIHQDLTMAQEQIAINTNTIQEHKEQLNDVQTLLKDNAPKNLLLYTIKDLKTINVNSEWQNNTLLAGGIRFTVNTNTAGRVTSIVLNGTATRQVTMKLADNLLLTAGKYTIPIYNSQLSNESVFYNISPEILNEGMSNTNITSTTIFDVTSTTSYAYTIYIRNGVTLENFELMPQIQYAISDINFEEAYRTQKQIDKELRQVQNVLKDNATKNVFNKNVMLDAYSGIRTRAIELQPNTTYTASTSLPLNDLGGANWFIYKESESPSSEANGVWDMQSRTFITDESGIMMISYRIEGASYSTPEEFLSYDFQIEIGEVATAFESYYRTQRQLDVDINKINTDIKTHSTLLVDNAQKNLLEITADTQTVNGVTFTFNKNSAGQVTSIVANGTAMSTIYLPLKEFSHIEAYKGYFLSGCPSGGNKNSYFMYIFAPISFNNLATDIGAGGYILIDSDDDSYTGKATLNIAIRQNWVCNNLTFYPMIRKSEISDDTYEPYYRSQRQIDSDLKQAETAVATATSKNAEQDALLIDNAGKNLLEITADTQTINGVTFTFDRNSAGQVTSVVANGTASLATGVQLYILNNNVFSIANGEYTITGCPNGGGSNTFRLWFDNRSSDGGTTLSTVSDDGIGAKLTITQGKARCYIFIAAGYAANNLTFYPMIRKAEISDSTFEPFYRSQKKLDADLSTVEAVQETQNDSIDVLKNEVDYNLLDASTWHPYTIGGVTLTKNADGSVKLTGQNTYGETVTFRTNCPHLEGEYAVSGVSNGNMDSSYYGQIMSTDWIDNQKFIDGTLIYNFNGSKSYYYRLGVAHNYSFPPEGITFYPMITKPEYAGLPFKPYIPTNAELAAKLLTKADIGYNLFNVGGLIERSNYPYVSSGVTFTINQDNSITATGTAEQYGATANIQIPDTSLSGTYLISGITGGSDSTYSMRVFSYDSGVSPAAEWYTGEQEYNFTKSKIHYIQLKIAGSYAIPSGGITFYPMITQSAFSGYPYQPYIPSGKELLDTVIHTTIGLAGSTKIYPYQQTTASISFQERRLNTDYTVEVFVDTVTGSGDVGTTFIKNKTRSGFEVGFTGSADSADVTIIVRGGWT